MKEKDREGREKTWFILNKSPIRDFEEITPKEAWSRRKPDLSHLKISGFLCYEHVLEQVNKKLDGRTDSMIFLGYHPT